MAALERKADCDHGCDARTWPCTDRGYGAAGSHGRWLRAKVRGDRASRSYVGAAARLHGTGRDHDGAVRAWAEQVSARHGPPDLLVNNAAVINANAPLWEISAAEFDQVIDVNIKGVVNVIRHFVPAMIGAARA